MNRLIEARYTSVPVGKARQPLTEKGMTAEVAGICLCFCSWAGEEDSPDCHKVL